jgi:hypothetical protein
MAERPFTSHLLEKQFNAKAQRGKDAKKNLRHLRNLRIFYGFNCGQNGRFHPTTWINL